MNKIICDICGTSYPDSADQCPICGYSRELNGDHILTDTEPEQEEIILDLPEEPVILPEPEDDILVPVPQEDIILPDFLEDEDFKAELDAFEAELNSEPEALAGPAQEPAQDLTMGEDSDDEEAEYPEEDEEDEPRSNAGLIVILVILIVALLGVIGFIAYRYFLPNLDIKLPFFSGESTSATTEATESQAPEITTEPTVPCTGLTMVSEGVVVLEEEGANWLIHVSPAPENTTDPVVYSSSDEAVVTVDGDGKLTAVGQGTAVITVTCGDYLVQCNVTCFFIQETTEPELTTAPDVFEGETTAPTEPEATTPATEAGTTEKNDDGTVTLTLKKTDLTFTKIPSTYILTFLEEDINMDEVTWFSSNGKIAFCNGGKLSVVNWGTCTIYAEYRGVRAQCIIRVVAR